MKLISSFKDYYDYNIGLYGIDNKVIYNRLPFDDKYTHVVEDESIDISLLNPFIGMYDEYKYCYLLFCGRIFYIKTKSYSLDAPYELASIEEIIKELGYRHTYLQGTSRKIDTNKVYDSVMKIHEITKHPVLIMQESRRGKIYLDRNIPILKDIKGFASVVDSKQCYLDITQCIIDINNTEGVPNMTDTDKVVSHGFDKKISFRHRK